MLSDNLVEMYQEAGIQTYAQFVAKEIIKNENDYTVVFENGEKLTGGLRPICWWSGTEYGETWLGEYASPIRMKKDLS